MVDWLFIRYTCFFFFLWLCLLSVNLYVKNLQWETYKNCSDFSSISVLFWPNEKKETTKKRGIQHIWWYQHSYKGNIEAHIPTEKVAVEWKKSGNKQIYTHTHTVWDMKGFIEKLPYVCTVKQNMKNSYQKKGMSSLWGG